MTYYNNAIITKRELLVRLFKLLKDGELLDKIDRIPLDMRPRTKNPIRCCVHKDRAVIKYKIMAMLGYDISEEVDELQPLKEYARHALTNHTQTDQFLTIVDDACSSCVQVNYTVSNLCQGCEGRPCQVNCPKDAITVINGKANIDHQKCVNCGLCQKVCPFHAIAYLPVPCEEACPVKAIKKNSDGVEEINFEACIHCGKCMMACPFGAISEKSQIIPIYNAINNPQTKTVALVAPAILSQFNASSGQILKAIQTLGFDAVLEVAKGAELTTQHETKEWQEKISHGASFMTTSCCPAYVDLVDKHIPGLQSHVSHTPSPMAYTAQLAKEQFPDCKVVFIGPCLAKRKEAYCHELIDYSLTAEELGAFMAAENKDVNAYTTQNKSFVLTPESRGFAASGGVTQAIQNQISLDTPFKPHLIDGLTKKTIKLLKSYTKRQPMANFIEVMACEGGCINGPVTIAPPAIAQKNLKKVIDELQAELACSPH
jgi:[FeFe] hydrogenase (group B1/B3)